jgi:hypothetical protein
MMERTVEIQLQELREQIAVEIERLIREWCGNPDCHCGDGADFYKVAAQIARGK